MSASYDGKSEEKCGQTIDVNQGDQPIELTILMPCLNEAETIETCIRKAHSFLNRSKVSGEILIADNGSTDGSQEIASRLNARVINVANEDTEQLCKPESPKQTAATL